MPLNLLDDFPGIQTRFELVPMAMEDPTRQGRRVSVDIGPSLWYADYTSKVLKPTELRYWKARLHELHDNTFYGYDMLHCYPAAHPNGSGPYSATGELAAVDSDQETITLTDLAPGQIGTIGDYLSFSHGDNVALHQVVEPWVADTGGEATFRVRPYIRGYTPDAPVTFHLPPTIMVLIPGSVSATTGLSGRGVISFSARQTVL